MINWLFRRLFRRIPRANVELAKYDGPLWWRSIEGDEFYIATSYLLDGDLYHELLDSDNHSHHMSDEHLKRTLAPYGEEEA
jgi:hypothetical protein